MKSIQQLKLLPILLLSGCAMLPGQHADKWTADRYYNEARQAQTAGDYNLAIQRLNELVEFAPESPYAQLAPLELAFAHYKRDNFDAALTEVNRFIEQQPDHTSIDYAYYLKGISYFNQSEKASNINLSRKSYQVFSELSNSFPNSQYQNDALKRMGYLRNKLAYSELEIAKQDMLAGNIDAAKSRAKYISINYANTDAAIDALTLMAEATPIAVAPVLSDTLQKEQITDKASADEVWLLQQNPVHFTVQIAGTSKKKWLNSFIDDNKLQNDVAYYRRSHNGKDWYSVLYGNYSEYDDANTAAQHMMTKLGVDGVWVRTFKDVQVSIEGTIPTPR